MVVLPVIFSNLEEENLRPPPTSQSVLEILGMKTLSFWEIAVVEENSTTEISNNFFIVVVLMIGCVYKIIAFIEKERISL